MSDKVLLFLLFRFFIATILIVPMAIIIYIPITIISFILNSTYLQDLFAQFILWAFFSIAGEN